LRESDRERRLKSEQCATNPSQAVTLRLLFGGQRRPSGPTTTRARSRTEPGSKRITSPVFLLGPGSSCTAGRVEPSPKGWPGNQTGQTWPSQAKCLVGSPTKHIRYERVLCLVSTQKLFTLSHRMFRHIHEILNIDKQITNCTICMDFARRIF
jgi:hypothetical protein